MAIKPAPRRAGRRRPQATQAEIGAASEIHSRGARARMRVGRAGRMTAPRMRENNQWLAQPAEIAMCWLLGECALDGIGELLYAIM